MTTYSENMSGGVQVAGEAIETVDLFYIPDGGPVLTYGSAYTVNNNQFYPDGGPVLTTGSADASISQMYFDLDIAWNVHGSFIVDKSFSWNVGEQSLKWYVVTGKCKTLSCQIGVSNDQPCDGKFYFVQNIFARTPSEVCQQLSAEKISWQLESLQQYSRSPDPALVSPTDTCNYLTTIPFCDLPPCIEFCIHTDAVTNIKATTQVIDAIYSYTGSGTAVFSGNAATTGASSSTSIFEYTPLDTTVYTGGSAQTSSSWKSILETDIVATTTLEDIAIIFGTGTTAPALTLPAQIVSTSCGSCTAMPVVLYLHHNLQNAGNLSDFLKRNGLSLPSPIPLHYNSRIKGWVGNYHLSGYNQADAESWRFSIEWACASNTIDITSPSYKFTLLVNRILKNSASDTKIKIVFPPDQICTITQSLAFDFSFFINALTNVFGNSVNVVSTDAILFDKIRLFKSSYYNKNPLIKFRLSKNTKEVSTQYQTVNI